MMHIILAAITAVQCFATMPDSLAPLLSAAHRHELVEFVASGMEGRMHNRLDEEATLTVLSDTHVAVRCSASSRMDIKLLHTSDSVLVLAVINTVCAPVADSRVAFYDAEWRPLPGIELPMPQLDADVYMTEICPSPDCQTFTLTVTVPHGDSPQPVVCEWNGEGFAISAPTP